MTFIVSERQSVRIRVRSTSVYALVCVCETEKKGSCRVKEHEYMHAEKHVGECLIHFHTPTQKAFGACCATAHFDSSTNLINLLLALLTKTNLRAMLNCKNCTTAMEASDLNLMKLFCDAYPIINRKQYREPLQTDLILHENIKGILFFFLEILLWMDGADRRK